jgi:hypothetical protein
VESVGGLCASRNTSFEFDAVLFARQLLTKSHRKVDDLIGEKSGSNA